MSGDLEFSLFEILRLDAALEAAAYGDLDAGSVRQILQEARRLAEGPLAESFTDADRNPPVFHPDSHSVTVT